MELFNIWWNRYGHWTYTYAKALEIWKTRGIDGLPRYREGA